MFNNPTESKPNITPQEILNDLKMRLNNKYDKVGIKFRLFGWYEEKIFVNYRLEINCTKTKQKKNLLTIKHTIDNPFPVWVDSDKFVDDIGCENPQEFWNAVSLAVQDGKVIEETINGFAAIWN